MKFIKKYVDEIVTVSDYELMEAFLLLVEKHKLIAEGSGILSLAALKKLHCKRKKSCFTYFRWKYGCYDNFFDDQ